MAERYYFFNSIATDRRRHQASDMADYWESFLSDGLIHEDEQPQLEVVADGTSRNVTLSVGRALLKGHLYINDDDLNKMIDGPDATLDRIDRLVLRYDNTIEERSIKSFIIKGVEAENPEPPELTREGDIYEISLAQIRLVAGKAFVEQSDIIDERLDESVCGLSSSLVTVPTDIYNREFREMLEAMRGEWLEWYDSIVKDTYVTNTTYYDDRRDTDRQLANLNAIADIDNRAIGNTGKFYDFFDGTNEYSEAKIDEAKTVLLFDVEAGDNRITVESADYLRVGNEYTLVGLENLNSLETITRTILIKDILPNNVIELVDDLDTNLIAGSYLLRSNFIDNEFVHEFFVESWATVQIIKELTGYLLEGHATTRDAFPTMLITSAPNRMIMQDVNKIKEYENNDLLAGEFNISGHLGTLRRSAYLSNHERYIIGSSESSDSFYNHIFDKQTGIRISSVGSLPLVRDVGQERRHLVDIIDLDGEEHILISDFGPYGRRVDDGALRIGKINNGSFVYLSAEEQSYILGEDFPKLQASNIFVTGKNHLFLTIPGENLMEYKADGDKIKFVKAHEFRFISTSFQVSDIFMNGELLQLATFGTSKSPRSDRDTAILRYVDGEYQEVSVPFRSDLTLVTGGADRRTLFDGEALYDFDGENFTLIQDFKDKVHPSYVHQGFVFYDYVFLKKTPSNYEVYTKDGTNVTIDDLILRYNFNNPVKNIATWIDFEKYEKDVEVYLSNVEVGEQETFERLPVTVRDNEAEALKVNNIFEKPRNALKLLVPLENGIKKILGAIE